MRESRQRKFVRYAHPPPAWRCHRFGDCPPVQHELAMKGRSRSPSGPNARGVIQNYSRPIRRTIRDWYRFNPATSGRVGSTSNADMQGFVRPRSTAGLRRAGRRWHCLNAAMKSHSGRHPERPHLPKHEISNKRGDCLRQVVCRWLV